MHSFGIAGLRATNLFQDFSSELNIVIAGYSSILFCLVFKELVIKL